MIVVLEGSHSIVSQPHTTEEATNQQNKTDEAEMASFVYQQLQTSGKQHGYRWMRHNGIICIAYMPLYVYTVHTVYGI